MWRRLDLRRVGEQLDVSRPHRGQIVGGVELELVEELRAVAADEPEELRGAFRGELVRAREVEPSLEPDRVGGQVLEQHRPALGDGVVAEPPLLRRQRRGRVREVLGVAGLVEQGPPVVRPALRLHHEDDAAGHLDRRAERARILVRAILEIELDVLLGVEVDAEVGERDLEGRQHPVGRERRVPPDAAPRAPDVPAPDLAEPEADTRAEEAVARLLPEVLGVGEAGAGTARRGRRAENRSSDRGRRSSSAPSRRVSRCTTCAACSSSAFRCSSVSSFLAASIRSRTSRSSSFISRGLSIRNGISSPSTVAVSVASSSATRSASSLTKLPR